MILTDNTGPTPKEPEPELRTSGRGFTYQVNPAPEEMYFPTDGDYSTDGKDSYVMQDQKWKNVDPLIDVIYPKYAKVVRMRVSELTKFLKESVEPGELLEVIYIG